MATRRTTGEDAMPTFAIAAPRADGLLPEAAR